MNDDNNTKQPILNHLSLCTGYEGIGQGLRRVLPTLREIAYSEIEDYAIANLVTKIEEGRLHPAPIFTNLKTIPYRKFLGKVSVLSGGFPCQPFSAAGLRKATDDPRHLYPFIAEGISQCKPTFVFLENVSGIISAKTHDGESVLHYVCRDLESRGYKVSWGIFSASEVGLPHQRKRVFILGHSTSGGSRRVMGDCSQKGQNIKSLRTDGQSNELSNSYNFGCRGRKSRSEDRREWSVLSREQEGREMVSQTEGCSGDIFKTKELGNSEGTRQSSSNDRQRKAQLGGTSSWDVQSVARPNEPQHEWEYPRVITKEIPQSELGGTTDGFRNRDNRLRLLGNGVVPQVAAKAFKTLLQKNLTT
jgi:DNA (cytosine-5)-methyltransferase 1